MDRICRIFKLDVYNVCNENLPQIMMNGIETSYVIILVFIITIGLMRSVIYA